MKWSQGLCTAIFLDGIYAFSPTAKPNPRMDRDFSRSPSGRAATANAFAADWGLAPEAGAAQLLDAAGQGVLKRRPANLTLES
jgi:hypothetical protein